MFHSNFTDIDLTLRGVQSLEGLPWSAAPVQNPNTSTLLASLVWIAPCSPGPFNRGLTLSMHGFNLRPRFGVAGGSQRPHAVSDRLERGGRTIACRPHSQVIQIMATAPEVLPNFGLAFLIDDHDTT